MKKVFSLLLALFLAAVLLPIKAEAARIVDSGTCGDNLTWTLDDQGTLTISGTGKIENYQPSAPSPWYGYRDSITSLTLEDGITSIGQFAFYNCINLTSISIPDSVMVVGDYAFMGCTALACITIPDSVTSLGLQSFYDCSSLTDIYVDSIQSWLYFSQNYSDSCLTKANSLDKKLYVADKLLTDVSIPKGTTDIGSYTFYCCTSLTSVTIPGSVKTIGTEAFYSCTSLTNVTLSDGLTRIGDSAFYNCTSLTGITIPDSVTDISGNSFWGCVGLTYVAIPDGVINIGDFAFYNCSSLTSVTIPNSVKTIGNCAFWRCTAVSRLTIGNGLTGMGLNVFNECDSLTDIYIDDLYSWLYYAENFSYSLPNRFSSIAKKLYVDGKLVTELIIPEGTTVIGSHAFYSFANLSDLTIPDSVTRIGSYAFGRCAGLTRLSIPDSVSGVGEYAFAYCHSLTSVSIGGNVTSFGDCTFVDCTGLTSVVIRNGATEIGNYMFYNCTGLTSVTVPGSVIKIGVSAFESCVGLTSVIISEGVDGIGKYAFKKCSSIDHITIPDSVTSVGSAAFAQCTGLTSVTIGNGVTSLNSDTFRNCSSLNSVSIGKGVATIGMNTFLCCTSLEDVTLPESVSTIHLGAFRECSGLKAIIFSSDIPYIEVDAFASVAATAYYPAGNTTWTEDVMQDYGGTITWVPYNSDFSSVKPTISVTKNSYNSMKITWSEVLFANYYEVYRSTSADSGFVKLGTYDSKTLSKVSGSLATGTKYYYKVRAYRVVDGYKKYSAYSDVASGTPTLSAPTGVTVSKNSYNTLKVTWNKVNGASFYQVYRSVKGANDWKLLGTYDENTTSMTSRQLSTGTAYEYRVRCYRWANSVRQFSGWSTVKSGTPTLSAPTGVKAATGTTKGTVTVSWNKVDGATYYQVYRSANGTSDWKLLGTYDEDTTSMTSKALGSGQTYYYRVRCYRWAGGERQFSTWSTIVNAVAK